MFIDPSELTTSRPEVSGAVASPAAAVQRDGAAVRTLPVSMHCLLQHQRVLLLQGPMGGFFDTLAQRLAARGQQVHKIHFNGGDRWFYRQPGAVTYTGTESGWPLWLEHFVREHRIEAIVVFGQMRPVHRAARRVADETECAFYVFEEGYLRPDYVTLERDGVNAFSSMPRDAAFYRAHAPIRADQMPQPTGQRFGRMAWLATQYSVACTIGRPWCSRVDYHRPIHPVGEALRWLRGGWRKLAYGWRERHLLDHFVSPALRKRWFLVPLQVRNDSQVRYHSGFESVEDFVDEVMRSFAVHAPADTQLVFKHHPMDRAYSDYTRFLAERAAAHGLAGRVHYVHDLHLPTLLRHARGVVTINSTTGLQSLFHGTPVIALGNAFYDLPGLTCQRGLAEFWRDPGTVDRDLYWRFRAYMTEHTQLNASFYAGAPALDALGVDAPAAEANAPAAAAPLTATRA